MPRLLVNPSTGRLIVKGGRLAGDGCAGACCGGLYREHGPCCHTKDYYAIWVLEGSCTAPNLTAKYDGRCYSPTNLVESRAWIEANRPGLPILDGGVACLPDCTIGFNRCPACCNKCAKACELDPCDNLFKCCHFGQNPVVVASGTMTAYERDWFPGVYDDTFEASGTWSLVLRGSCVGQNVNMACASFSYASTYKYNGSVVATCNTTSCAKARNTAWPWASRFPPPFDHPLFTLAECGAWSSTGKSPANSVALRGPNGINGCTRDTGDYNCSSNGGLCPGVQQVCNDHEILTSGCGGGTWDLLRSGRPTGNTAQNCHFRDYRETSTGSYAITAGIPCPEGDAGECDSTPCQGQRPSSGLAIASAMSMVGQIVGKITGGSGRGAKRTAPKSWSFGAWGGGCSGCGDNAGIVVPGEDELRAVIRSRS